MEIAYKNTILDSLTCKATTVFLLLTANSLKVLLVQQLSSTYNVQEQLVQTNADQRLLSIYSLFYFRTFQTCCCFHSFLFD